MRLFIPDKPSPPENLQVSDVYADHCKLSWKPPADNGGADISGTTLFLGSFKIYQIKPVVVHDTSVI